MEDAVVHQQDADFGPAHVPYVHDLADEQVFGDAGDGFGADSRVMIADAFAIHGKGNGDDDPIPELIITPDQSNRTT